MPKKNIKSDKEEAKKTLTVEEYMTDLKLKSPFVQIYLEKLKLKPKDLPELLDQKKYVQFVQKLEIQIREKPLYESEIKDSFFYLIKTTMPPPPPKSKQDTRPRDKSKETAKERLEGAHRVTKSQEKVEFSEEKAMVLMNELTHKYDEFLAEEYKLKGVLNIRNLKALNYDLNLKMQFWKNNEKYREDVEKAFQTYVKFIQGKLREFSESTIIEKEEMNIRIASFDDLIRKKADILWNIKLLFKFLFELPQTGVVSLNEMKRYLESTSIVNKAIINLLTAFIEEVKKQCRLNSDYFSFYDVPDVIIKFRYGKKEYDCVRNFLNKAKKAYLKMKKLRGDKEEITVDDLTPLGVLTETLDTMKYKQELKENSLNKIIFNSETEIEEKKKKLDVKNYRVLETIENNILINYLNTYLEKTYTEHNLCFYIAKTIYNWIKGRNFSFHVSDFLFKFKGYINTLVTNPEFVSWNARELDKFNQRHTTTDNDESDTSRISGMGSKPSDRRAKKGGVELGDEELDLIGFLNPVEKSNENIEEEDIMKEVPEEPEVKKEEEETGKFYSPEGKPFNPKEKYGTLEPNYTEYEPKTTKYEAVLPPQYYLKNINEQSPSKEDKWFVRAHHLETLTSI